MSSQGRSEKTKGAYTSDIQVFIKDCGLSEIDTDKLNELAANWMNSKRRKLSPRTVGRRITSMRAFGKWLGMSLLENYSAPTPARAMPHPLPRLQDDLMAMIRSCRTLEQEALIALTGMCGCRIGEALDVHPERDFDLHHMLLTIRGKGDKTRIVPISKLAWRTIGTLVLGRRMAGHSTVLDYSDRYARSLITDIGSRAGISRSVSSHDLRATFATLAYARSGKDLRAVQELLGHQSPLQTQVYVLVALESLREATDFEWDDDGE